MKYRLEYSRTGDAFEYHDFEDDRDLPEVESDIMKHGKVVDGARVFPSQIFSVEVIET